MTDKFIRIKGVVDRTSLSESNVYARMAKGEFPKSIKLGAKTSVWLQSDIDAWMQEQIDRQLFCVSPHRSQSTFAHQSVASTEEPAQNSHSLESEDAAKC